MKKGHKTRLSLVSTLLVCGMAAGCSPQPAAQPGGGTAPAPAPQAGKPVTLTMWGGVPPESGPQKVVDNWNAQNPDIQVKYERFVNDDAGNLKLDTALATGQNVDLYVTYALPMLAKRVEAGNALDLSPYTEYNIDEKIGPVAKNWKVKDKYYGLPTTRSRSLVWLNKDALDEAGLPIPPLDWTMDDLKSYALKLKKDKRWGFLQHLSGFQGPLDGAVDAKGYVKADGTSNLDQPDVRKIFQTYFDMMHTDKTMVPLGEQLTTKMPVETAFLKGESGMLGAGEFIFRYANNLKDNPRAFKIAFAALPRVSATSTDYKYGGGLGDVISINPKSANKDAAWKFLKWYADGGMMPMAAGGRIPASKATNMEEAMKLMLGDNEKTYDVDSLKKVVFGEFPTFISKLPQQIVDARREEYEKFFLKSLTIDELMNNITKRHNDFLAKNKS